MRRSWTWSGAGTRGWRDGVSSGRSRAVGAVFDDLVTFFRPTYTHVREEKQRLELTREEAGDAAPPLRLGDALVTMSVPKDYQAPAAARGRVTPRDSQGLAV